MSTKPIDVPILEERDRRSLAISTASAVVVKAIDALDDVTRSALTESERRGLAVAEEELRFVYRSLDSRLRALRAGG